MNRHQRRQAERAKKQIIIEAGELERIKQDATNKAVDEAFSLMLLVPALVLRDKFGFGKTRIDRMHEECEKMMSCLASEHVTLEDIHVTLKEECGIDFFKGR